MNWGRIITAVCAIINALVQGKVVAVKGKVRMQDVLHYVILFASVGKWKDKHLSTSAALMEAK